MLPSESFYISQTVNNMLCNQPFPVELMQDEECENSDNFSPFRENILTCFNDLLDLFCASPPPADSMSLKLTAHGILIVAGCLENRLQCNLYSSSKIVEISIKIMSFCLKFSRCSTVCDLLLTNELSGKQTLCHSALTLASSHLAKANHKRLPFIRNASTWILCQLNYPHMSEYMPFCRPLALKIVDDYRPDLKLLGIVCLHHIAQHSLKTEIKYYGQADVIYDSLKNLIHQRDVTILQVIYPCLFDFLQIFDPPPCSGKLSSVSSNTSKSYDDLCDKLLSDIYIESSLQIKSILVEHLELTLTLLGSSISKHSKRFLLAFEHVLLSPDYQQWPTRSKMLEILVRFTKLVWPILNVFLVDIQIILLAFLDECGELPSCSFRDQLVDIFKLLSSFDNNTIVASIENCKHNENFTFLLDVLKVIQ